MCMWNQAIPELSGGAQENLSSSQLVELRFENLTMHVTCELNTDDSSNYQVILTVKYTSIYM